MKTHGESRRLPFKVGPMEAEGCSVTPSNGIEIQRYMSCTIPGHKFWNTPTIPGQYWHEHMHIALLVRVSQDPRTVLAWTHAYCTPLSEYPKIPRYPDHLHELQGMSCVEVFATGSSFLICKKCAWLSPSEALDCLLFNGTMSNWSQTFLICWFHRSEVTLIS